MRYAVIIKHPMRDMDYRVDIVDVPDNTQYHEIAIVIQRQMVGPFEVIAITEKIQERDISAGLEKLHRATENHIET